MTRTVGTVVRGIRIPILKQGDDLVQTVVDSLLRSAAEEGYELKNRDVVGITESVVARTQGNYVSVQDIARDIDCKFEGDIAVVFPILSRNRFFMLLKGIAMSNRKIYVFLNYPTDEVGNSLMDINVMDDLQINPAVDFLTEADYRRQFGETVLHPFTGLDYVRMYTEISERIEVYLTNDPRHVLRYTKEILVANIHERQRTKKRLLQAGAERVYCLDDLLTRSVRGSGFNAEYGLLGSNKATEEKIKLFPRNCKALAREVQDILREKTGKEIEVLVYGDGAFKDPQGKIWELADPVVSPGYTPGLCGLPNELKLKYIVDTELADLTTEEQESLMRSKIRAKDENLVGKPDSLGTTPRQLTDLLGSLCDLTSGSGDKGTPVVLIQGYFDNYASE